ncbi:hypothetical protein BDW22DRAFT_1346566 [Trametopsis cervina]|nr:hypothetical protein BDW22DRAFT_1346566 [Trametopsis cervina]
MIKQHAAELHRPTVQVMPRHRTCISRSQVENGGARLKENDVDLMGDPIAVWCARESDQYQQADDSSQEHGIVRVNVWTTTDLGAGWWWSICSTLRTTRGRLVISLYAAGSGCQHSSTRGLWITEHGRSTSSPLDIDVTIITSSSRCKMQTARLLHNRIIGGSALSRRGRSRTGTAHRAREIAVSPNRNTVLRYSYVAGV